MTTASCLVLGIMANWCENKQSYSLGTEYNTDFTHETVVIILSYNKLFFTVRG